MGVVIGVPEIWAAVAGSDFVWPTISTTVGSPPGPVAGGRARAVALIVMSGYSVFRVPPASMAVQADFQAFGRTPQGRLAKQDITLGSSWRPRRADRRGPHEFGVVRYFAFATAVVVVGALAASPSDNRFLSATSSTR